MNDTTQKGKGVQAYVDHMQTTIKQFFSNERTWIPRYFEPIHDNELPMNTHVRILLAVYKGETGRVIGYEQPPIGFVGWHYIQCDTLQHEPFAVQVHRDWLEVIE